MAFGDLLKAELFAQFLKAELDRSQFHKNTDQIVEHYSQQIRDTLQGIYSAAAISQAIRAAYQNRQPAKKQQAPAPPNLRYATGLKHCGNCKMYNRLDSVCWGYGNFPVSVGEVCDSWSMDPDVLKEANPDQSAARRAIDSLKGAADTGALEQVFRELYGDAYLQGTWEAAAAAKGTVLAGFGTVMSDLPDSYWDDWKPGYGLAASKVENGGLNKLLAEADARIKGITDQVTESIGNTIAQSLARGDSYQVAAQGVNDFLANSRRSNVVADTEYARAMTTASLETYQANAVEQVEWMAEESACPACQANADASPIKLGDDWPNGDVPVHPNCRCAIAPLVKAG